MAQMERSAQASLKDNVVSCRTETDQSTIVHRGGATQCKLPFEDMEKSAAERLESYISQEAVELLSGTRSTSSLFLSFSERLQF